MKRRATRRWANLSLWAALPLLLLSQACSTYSYFDVDLQVDTAQGFNTVMIGLISNCHVFVSGATTDDFSLADKDCHTIDTATGEIAKIQYATFADSGNVTFTLRLFEKAQETEGCQIGIGSVILPIDSGKTSALTVLKVPYKDPTNCP